MRPPLSFFASLKFRAAAVLMISAAAAAQQPNGNANLTVAWQPLGPQSVLSTNYGLVTGRITSLALDPNDTTGNTLYVGSSGGGVWKSTNASGIATFTPLTDTLSFFAAGGVSVPSLSIGALAVQPIANPVVLAGTGDPNDAADSLYGVGLLRSTDGGATWTLVRGSQDGVNGNHLFTGLAVAGIAFSSATPSLVVAAFSTAKQAATVGALDSSAVPGLYYSADAGVTWHMATLLDGATIVQQPLSATQTGNAATAVVYDAQRARFFAAVRGHGYYTSLDGITWTRLSAQPGTGLTTTNCPATTSANCPIFRGALTVQPATGDLYALTVDAANNTQGLWQDLCQLTSGACATPAPTFAARIDQAAMDSAGVIAQGDYNLALAAAPSTSSTTLFAGTIDLYRCTIATGTSTCVLRNTTNTLNGCNAPAQVAPAQHALAALVQTSGAPLLFLGNDGGLWRSPDGVAETGPVCSASDATHFNNLNSNLGSLAQIIGFAQHPTDSNTLLAGLGALGTAAASSATSTWTQLSAGEGGLPAIDPTTPTNVYATIGTGINLKQCTRGTACTDTDFAPPANLGAAQTLDDAALLHAPILLDPAQSSNVILGTCRVWRGAASGSAWSSANAISGALNGGTTPCTASSPLIRSLDAGGPTATSANAQSSGATVIYAGLAGKLDGGGNIPGHLFVTRNASAATPTWTDISLNPVINDASGFNPSSYAVTALAVDTHDATGATIFATIGGFNSALVYRSTDFGQHWLNLTANLPGAPSNAILIDPNDANTVYLALDAGVYVTTAITTCDSASCWSPLGTALPNAPAIALSAGANLLTGDGRRGMLRVATNGRGLWQQPLLNAISLAQPAITLSATNLTFAAQQVATQSAAQAITLTSTGNAPVTISSVSLTGDFTETDNCTSQTLAVNATCSVQILFAPTKTGTRSGQLTIFANIPGGQAAVALTGTGTAPATIVLTPLSLTFASTVVNQTSATQNLSIANTGGTAATLQTPVLTGDFSLTANTCGTTLAPAMGCTVSIAFTPTASGTRNGTFSITDSAGTQTATLTGTGQGPATDTLSSTSLTFAQQQVGTSSAAQQITLTNSGDVTLSLLSVSSSTTEFQPANACGTSLVAHSTCAVSVTFVPSATGTRTATLTVSDQFRAQTVALTGTGVAPPGVSLSPTALTFNATGVGLTTPAQTLTLTNSGGLPLTLSSPSISSNFVLAANNCSATLAANASCTLQIIFAPTTAGTLSGTLTLTTNATPAIRTVNLSGTGIDFVLTPSGATTANLSANGGTAAYPLLLQSLAGLSGSVALACTGAPAHSTCTVSPTSGTLGNTTSVVVTVQTGLSSAALHLPLGSRNEIFFALLLPVALFSKRKRLKAPLTLVMLSGILGCGQGRLLPDSTGPAPTPTPTGTYNLSITASSAGLTRTVPLTLVVQ